MSIGVALLVSGALIIATGFFVAVELAFVASRRSTLESMADADVRGARTAADALEDVTGQLFAAQLGITVCSLLVGLIAGHTAASIIEDALESAGVVPGAGLSVASAVVGLLIVVIVHIVFAEIVPKNIAHAAPETTARFLAPFHSVVALMSSPLVWVFIQLARPLLRAARISAGAEIERAATPRELQRMLDASHQEGLVETQERELLAGAFEFGDTRVLSLMIPHDQVVAVELGATVAEVEALVVSEGHSRIPVRQASSLGFLGFVHAKDLVRLPAEAADDAVPLELIRRMPVVSIEHTAEDLLFVMQRNRTHMAVVEAPGGGVAGMATLEDVLEELVGEIYDETDPR